MTLFTYTQLKDKISLDYDITDENFVSEDELLGYMNDAIDDAETAIHTMHWADKYFLTSSTFTWVSGTQAYSLPSTIYGNKIRQIFYSNGSSNYEIRRITDLLTIPFIQSGEEYKYILVNDATNGMQAKFYPTPAESSSNATIWFVRGIRRLTTSANASNTLELPECVNFVTQHVKYCLAKKSRRSDLIALEAEDLKTQYALMLEALKEMVPDENNLIPLDLSSYADQGLSEVIV